MRREISEDTKKKYHFISGVIVARLMESGGENAADYARKVSAAPSVNDLLMVIAEACIENGELAGERCCQDWPVDMLNPSDILTESEKDDLAYNFEAWNSGGEGYEKGRPFFHDEMYLSFAVARACKEIAKGFI